MSAPNQRWLARCAALMSLAGLTLFACTENNSINDLRNSTRAAHIIIAPRFAVSGAFESAPIVRVRLTVRNATSGAVLTADTVDVDPNDDSWTLNIDVPGDAGSIVVLIELLNTAGSVEWSGLTAPITVHAGETTAPQPVTVFQGPPDNLTVTAIAVTPKTTSILEGGSLQLNAAVTGGGPNAHPAWSSIDPSIGTVDGNGFVLTLRNGTLRVRAIAGAREDTATITVTQRPVSVEVAPTSATIASIGGETTFTARVTDARGADIAGQTVNWSSANTAIAEHLGNGRFRSIANGTTQAIATSVSNPALRGTANIIVAQRPGRVVVTPGAVTLNAVGAQQQFTASVTDGSGNPITAAVVWRTGNAAVATVNAAGLATATGSGNTLIRAVTGAGTPDSISGSATLQVAQAVQSITVAPASATLDALGDSVRFVATARDANGTAIPNVVFTWSSTNSSIASVDSTGLARALAEGATSILANVGTVRGSAILNIGQRVTSVTVNPPTATLNAIGQTVRLTAVARDVRNNIVPGRRAIWSSSNTAVATVDSTGLVTAVANGLAGIRAAVDDTAGMATITVQQVLANALVTPPADTVLVNDTATFTAVGRDANNHVMPGITFTWTSSDTTIATVNSTTGRAQGRALGTATIRATATSNAAIQGTGTLLVTGAVVPPPPPGPTPDSIAIYAGEGQSASAGSSVDIQPAVIVRDSLNNPLPNVPVLWQVTGGGGSITGPATVYTDSNGVSRVGGWTLGFIAGANTLTATASPLPAVTFHATGTAAAAAMQLALGGGRTFVGVSFTAPLTITLNTPAPAGGVTVTVTSSDTTKLRVQSPGTAFIAAGASTGTVTLQGVTAGNSTVTATASGYGSATLNVNVSLRLISLPAVLNVPFTQSASLPIQLAEPAPTGGTVVNIVIADTTITTASSYTVTIAAGSSLASITLLGRLPGTTTLTATATDYIGSTDTIRVQANLDIIESNLTINSSFGGNINVGLKSNGSPIAAPSGGINVALSAGNAACVTVQAAATIPAGLTQVTVPVSYGGSATLACSTRVTATATNLAADSTLITVNSVPAINGAGATVGQNLMRALNVNLGASNHGGVTVHIASADSSRMLVSPSTSIVGTGSIDIFVPNGSTFVSYYAHGLATDTISVNVVVSATGFTTATIPVSVKRLAYDLNNFPTVTTTLSPPTNFIVRVGISTNGTSLSELQTVRAGYSGVVVQLTSSDSTVAKLQTVTDTAARTVSITIPAGQTGSSFSISTGGVALLPRGAGTSVITATIAGGLAMTNASLTTTISAPNITTTSGTVAVGLQTNANFQLAASNHGGVTVHVASNDSTRLLVSLNSGVAGSPSIDVPIANGNTFFTFTVQAKERAGTQIDTATITVSAPGFNSVTGTWQRPPAGIDVVNLATTTTSLSSLSYFNVRIGAPNAILTGLNSIQSARFGGPGVVIHVNLSDTTIAKLVYNNTDTAGVATFTIPGGYSSNTANLAFQPRAPGVDTVRATSPTAYATTTATKVVTISGPGMSLSSGNSVGAGLQKFVSGTLAAGNHGGVTVHLVVSDSSKMLIALNADSIGHGSIDIPMPNGSTFFSYYIQGIDGNTGTVTVTGSASGFTNGTATMFVVAPAVDLVSLPATTTTLSGESYFYVRSGVPSGTCCLNEIQEVRKGGPGFSVTVSSSTTAGAIVYDSIPSGSLTVFMGPRVSQLQFRFRPLTSGSTVVSATAPGMLAISTASRTISVTAPGITLSAGTIGAGLMRSMGGNLTASNHGGTIVRIRSSNPAVAKVSATATSVGADSVDIPVANFNSFFSYYVHGVDGQTGTVTITASASGFTDGTTTAAIVPGAFDVVSLSTSMNTASAPPNFYLRLGIGNTNNTGLNELQARRFGASALSVTVNSSNAAVGRIYALPDTVGGASANTTIIAGSYYTPFNPDAGSLFFKPVGIGNTQVTATIPGFIAQTSATVNVTIAAASMTINVATVGAGLERSMNGNLSGGNHGGVTVHLVSATPSKLLLSPDATTAGTGTLDIVLPAGQTFFAYYIQGVELTTGLVAVTATATGFTGGSGNMTVVQPALVASGLPGNWNVSSGDVDMQMLIGTPNAGLTFVNEYQNVRAGSPGFTVTLTSSNAAVGIMVNSAGTGASRTVTIPALQYYSNYPVSSGGIAFRPLTTGTTTVSATAPNVSSTTAASLTVTVN